MRLAELVKAVILGIIEGVTEWLPISSTGHMLLFDRVFSLDASAQYKELFFVVIQLGAIAAVPILYFNRLNPFSKTKSAAERSATLVLWRKVIIAVLPAAAVGALLDGFISDRFYNHITVAAALIVYGVIFVLFERMRGNKPFSINNVYEIKYKDALAIGAFQTLSLIPGTSRSGSTIIGGMLIGASGAASAEFSFFMAVPVMLGASALKLFKFLLVDGARFTPEEILLLLVGMAVSFSVSLFCIRFLTDFVKRHSFAPFGVYRIILGLLVLVIR